MKHQLKIEKNTAKLTLTIPKDKVEEAIKNTVKRLSEDADIKGFRKGKVPAEVIRKQYGEMKLLDIASEELIRTAYIAAMLEENLDTVGQPHFNAEKLAPGNDLVITAELTLRPKVTKFGDLSKVKVEKKTTKAKKEQIERAKKDLTMMQTKEVRKTSKDALEKGDKAVIDLTMKEGGVVLEGGEGRSHGIYTAESHYIEGMVDKILGMKEGEEKKFDLSFPKDHYQKHLAGKKVDFEIKLNEIFKLDAPKLDDAFAKNLGMKDAKELEGKISQNIEFENQAEEDRRVEKELFGGVIKASKFDEIPELLLNQEIQKMIQELTSNIQQQGMELEGYLKQIGKSMDELKLDFAASALERVRASMILAHIIETEKITVKPEEIDVKLDEIAKQYEGKKDLLERVYSPEYRSYIEMQLLNQSALGWLKGKVLA